MLLQMALFHSFLWLSTIPLHIYKRIFFIHSFVNGHTDFFHVLATVNSGAMNIGVHVFFFKVVYFPGGSNDKASVYDVGDPGSISGLGRSLGEGNGNTLQYYCLENPMDRGVWWAAVHGVTESRTRLSD